MFNAKLPKQVICLTLAIIIIASNAWAAPVFEWIDDEWQVFFSETTFTNEAKVQHAFGASASDGQITDLSSDKALLRSSASVSSDFEDFATAIATVHVVNSFRGRKFRLANAPHGWRVDLSGVLRGALSTNDSLFVNLHPLAGVFADATIWRGDFPVGNGIRVNENRLDNEDGTDSTFDPTRVKQIIFLPDGEYTISANLTSQANANPHLVFSAHANADFFTLIDRDYFGRPMSNPISRGWEVSISATPFAPGISNGSFEAGRKPDPGSFITLGQGSDAIQDWEVTSGSVDYKGTYWEAAEGERSVDLNGNEPGAISQVFVTNPGTTYGVRFALAGNPDGGPSTKVLQVTAAGESEQLTFDTTGRSRQNMGYLDQMFLFTATTTTTQLTFTSLTDGPYGPVLDDVFLLENVNTEVNFVRDEQSYETVESPFGSFTPGCGGFLNLGIGFVGKFTFNATLAPKQGSAPLSNLVVRVAELADGNRLQDRDGGPGGAGAFWTIPTTTGADPEYRDGLLIYPENIRDIPFSICLRDIKPFTFHVDVFGTTQD